jgi:hypothetical protein
MGDILVLGAAGRACRLDVHAVEEGAVGWRNVLPGYHEVRVHGDGVWHVAGLVLGPGASAALGLAGGRLVDAHHEAAGADRGGLVDVLARDVAGARSWQQATAALACPLDAVDESDALATLQALFVRHALHDDAGAAARLAARVADWGSLAQVRAAPAAAAAAGRAVAAMVALDPTLAAALPAGDLVGALSDAGNDDGDAELLAAANAVQLALAR